MEIFRHLFTLSVTLLLACHNDAMDTVVSKQMKRIYRDFKRGILPPNGVNTVKQIQPQKGSITSDGNMLYNLDALSKKEVLIKAEFYFYRRTSDLSKSLQIEFSEISPYYQYSTQKEVLSSIAKGWQVIDVTLTLKKCTNTINTNNHLGVGFTHLDEQQQKELVNMEDLLRHHGSPFLLVQTNNTQSLDSDHITGGLKSMETENYINGDFLFKRRRRSILGKRLLQSDYDRRINEIQKEPLPYFNSEDSFNELTNAIEDDIMSQKNSNQEITTGNALNRVNENEISVPPSVTKPKLQLIPWPELNKKPVVTAESYYDRIPVAPASSEKQEIKDKPRSCRKESLRLAFDDIGWGLRIIEPRKFDMYYCTGLCDFPSSLGRKPTNHATLQSILASIRSASTPQPCCVPDKLSAVTLMYYDQFSNIVTKVYQDMVVESCSCR